VGGAGGPTVRMFRTPWWRRADVPLIRAGLTFAVARAWKERVQRLIDRNKALGRRPGNQDEISKAVGLCRENLFSRRGTEAGAARPSADTGLCELALMAWCLGVETRDLVPDDATLIAHAARAVGGPAAGGVLLPFPDAIAYAHLCRTPTVLRGDALDPAAVADVWRALSGPPADDVPPAERTPADYFPKPDALAAAAWRVAGRLAERIGRLFDDRRPKGDA